MDLMKVAINWDPLSWELPVNNTELNVQKIALNL
jgi:hypothetical protein